MTEQRHPLISPERKGAYYGGMALIAIGFLLFISNFFLGPDVRDSFDEFGAGMKSMAARGVGGMLLMIAGGLLMRFGAQGAAGSGLLLDPEKAREDLKPWAKMSGGLTADAMGEVPLVRKLEDHLERGTQPAEPHVKVRCRNCQALNDESAKFCNQCAAAL
jgi:hypothetical protein